MSSNALAMSSEVATLFAAAAITDAALTGSTVGFTANALGLLNTVLESLEKPSEFSAFATNEYFTPLVRPVIVQFGVSVIEFCASHVPTSSVPPTAVAVTRNKSG